MKSIDLNGTLTIHQTPLHHEKRKIGYQSLMGTEIGFITEDNESYFRLQGDPLHEQH
jgi:hypothetical protein